MVTYIEHLEDHVDDNYDDGMDYKLGRARDYVRAMAMTGDISTDDRDRLLVTIPEPPDEEVDG